MLIYAPDSTSKTSSSSRHALFLDRDGVINKEINYLHRIKDFKFIDGIFDLCKTAIEQDYRIIVITNQAGIARGYYAEDDLAKLTKWMIQEFAGRGIEISKVYACPHLNDDCQDRKPNPGMLLQAQQDFNLDMSECIFIGDKPSDMEAGTRAGIDNLILFCEDAPSPKNIDSKVKLISNLKQAKEFLNTNL